MTPLRKSNKFVTTHSTAELGEALGLSPVDAAEIEFRSELNRAIVRIMEHRKLTHAEIARLAGTSRKRVTAKANGNTHGVSMDVLIRIIAANGYRAALKIKKAPQKTGLAF